MILAAIVGLTLIAVSISLLVQAASASRIRTAATVVSIGTYGFAGGTAVPVPSGRIRGVLDGIAEMAGAMVAGRVGRAREAAVRTELVAAGLYSLAPRKFIGYQLLCAASFPITWTWFAASTGLGGGLVALGGIAAVAMGWYAPLVLVRRRARYRLAKVDYALPELIDLLVVTVEAGLGFTGSLKLAADRLGGPLGEELRLGVQEQSFGLSTSEVLVNMLGRVETPGMRSFVRSVTQGESLGVSIGQILRNLASEMRKRRWAAAEERAQKAPVKMLFPLVFMIFPAMFVVMLGPAVYAFLQALG